MNTPDSHPPTADADARWPRLSAVYGAAGLALIVGARLLASAGPLPEGWIRPLVFVLVAGYPVVAAVVWAREPRPAGPETRTSPRLAGADVAWMSAGIAALLIGAWIGLRPGARGATDTPDHVLTPEPRVAVLPLLDIDGRGDRTFADGVTELLAEGLAAVEGIEVLGRVSAASFVDVNRDAASAGEYLGAGAVVDGTVRRSSGSVRLSLRLIEAETGEPLWTFSGDTTAAGLFVLRDRIVDGVAAALGHPAGDRTLRRLERRRTTPRALDLYMLGRFRWASGSRGDLAEAASYYHLAIEADSGFAAAWTALADAYATLPRFTRFPPAGTREYGAAAARTALQLDAESAGAHTALGEILYVYEHDWSGARAHLDRAAELDPGDAAPRDRLCELELTLGDLEGARASCAAARRRDPLAFRPGWLEAGVLRAAGDLPGALARLDSLASVYPDYEPLAGERAITRLLLPAAAGAERDADVETDLAEWFELLAGPALADSLAASLAGAPVTGSAGTRRVLDRVAAELDPDPALLVALFLHFGETDRAAKTALAALEDRAPGALRFGVFPEYAALRVRPDVRRALEAADLPLP